MQLPEGARWIIPPPGPDPSSTDYQAGYKAGLENAKLKGLHRHPHWQTAEGPDYRQWGVGHSQALKDAGVTIE